MAILSYTKMIATLKRLNYRHVLPDVVLITLSIYLSFFLRLGWPDVKAYLPILDRYALLFAFLRISVFTALGIYDIIWRYISLQDAWKLIKGVLLSTILIIAASYLIDLRGLPRATFLIDLFLCTAMLGGIRFARRFLYERQLGQHAATGGRKVVIIGAGANGRTLAARFNTDSDVDYRLIGFIDDDPQKVGRIIAGIKVLGSRTDLARILKEQGVQEVIVAISRPSGSLLREVVKTCRAFRLQPRLVNALSKGHEKTKNIQTFRAIELGDLLNRSRKNIDNSSIRELVRNKRVLVTGAGGSIGSELARQILQLGPSAFLMLDHSEFNLYQIDQELRGGTGDQSHIVPLLVDVKDRQTLENVFKEYRPELVFHAAAYKHVHLVECNPFPSILNNIMGTRQLLDLCEQYDVSTFVLISTDKAVNPIGVMGSTKRICELMVASAGKESGRRYCTVRFGNVLGSSGSLIPLLTRQIQNGEPVTITHPDMTRYFMLISEAVSLVLRAATIAKPGDITLLNMGEPVRIVDVAKSLIALMGRTEEDCPIVFTGLRPGEKLFEELYMCGNELNTSDPDILVVPSGDRATEQSREAVDRQVDRIIALAQQGNRDAIYLMSSLVKSSYTPKKSLPEASDLAPVISLPFEVSLGDGAEPSA